jgi:hypothetical protein
MFYHKFKSSYKPEVIPPPAKIISITLTAEILAKYKSHVFIETGTYNGGGIQIALDVGFPVIYSIESDKSLCEFCRDRFSALSHIKIFHGLSKDVLPTILKGINTKSTFWLDAHDFGGGASALYTELDIIGSHYIKDHHILIDDRAYFETWDIEESVVLDKVKSINKDYKIIYENKTNMDGNSMLIATL